MNDVNGLWMHKSYDPFQNLNWLQCFDCEDCEDCPFCGISERYKLMGKVIRRYKGGFEIYKDWDDLREALQ